MPEKSERIRKYWRKPKAVLRALGKYADGSAHAFHKEEILDWLNAAAPMAASKLIAQCASEGDLVIRQDPDSGLTVEQQVQMAVQAGFINATQIGYVDRALGQRAAIDILDRVVGRPRPQAEVGESPPGGNVRSMTITIVDSENGSIIDADPAESGASAD